MTDRVLSGAEIDAAWDDMGPFESMRHKPQHAADFLRRFARAVEAAVLAKVPSRLVDDLCARVTGELFKPKAERTVTEREARKRERAAYMAGLADNGRFTFSGPHADLEARYPLPACDKCGQVLP